MPVSLPSRLRDPRIHHNHFTLLVFGNALQGVGRLVTSVANVRIRPHHKHKIGLVMIGMQRRPGGAVQHPLFDQPMLTFLLRKRIKETPRLQQRKKGNAIRRIQMIRLPAYSDQAKRAGRILLYCCRYLRTDLANRRVPAYLFKPAFWFTLQGVAQSLRMIDIVIDTKSLVTYIAIGHRTTVVSANVLNMSVANIDS